MEGTKYISLAYFVLVDESDYNIIRKYKFTNNLILSSTFTQKSRENNAEQIRVSDAVSRPVDCDGGKTIKVIYILLTQTIDRSLAH
jgi:hypothetical protein